MRVAVTMMATDPPDQFRELVKMVEAGGFEALWVCDSSLHARDVYVYLTVVATASTRLAFGPNCTHPYTRHPAITMNAMASLHELSGGRARLALGAGDRPVGELGYRPASVAAVRETIAVVKALERGETLDAPGPTARLAAARSVVPLPSPLPVYVAASGPRMLRMAGEIADGVLFLAGSHAACIKDALGQIEAGAAAAGRAVADLDVACTVAGALGDDASALRDECVPMAAWFPQTAPRYAAMAGVPPAVTAAIRAEYAGGHFDAARRAFAHVTDEMIDRFTIAGPAELWVRRLDELVALGVRHLNIFLLARDKRAMILALAERVLPRLGRA